MPKYTSDALGYQIQKAGEEILLIIANELAELNRLKRIQINKNIPHEENYLVDEA